MSNNIKPNLEISNYTQTASEATINCEREEVNSFNKKAYEIDPSLQYRIVESTTSSNASSNLDLIEQSSLNFTSSHQFEHGSSQPSDKRITLFNELQANRPCVIYPKLSVISSQHPKAKLISGLTRKRDEVRRATHNEVERRRRDKINHWIERLKELLPEEVSSTETQQPTRTINDSKSTILIRACEYIRSMKEELENVKMCLTDIHDIVNLKAENEILLIENNRLKEILSRENQNVNKID